MTRPMAWMAAVRDHPERPPAMQCHVLDRLALRMDWSTGAGFASAGQLATDAQCRERTVRNATAWARKAGLLVQARRGHRLGDGRVIASEWRLALPASTGTGMPVEEISTGTDSHLNRHETTSQPARGAPPSRTSSSRTSSSAVVGAASARRPTPLHPTGYGLPLCPQCGKPFTRERLDAFDDDFTQMAFRGEVVCSPECEWADSHCAKCNAELRGDEIGMCVWCTVAASKNGAAS